MTATDAQNLRRDPLFDVGSLGGLIERFEQRSVGGRQSAGEATFDGFAHLAYAEGMSVTSVLALRTLLAVPLF